MLVRANPTKHRYEAIDDDDVVAGFITYKLREGRYWLVHTEIADGYQGTGVGAFLVRKTLDDLRSKSAVVVPTCPFVAGWIKRHPDYEDLVDTTTLREFKRSRRNGRRRTVRHASLNWKKPTMAKPCAHVPDDLLFLPDPWPVDGCAECLAAGRRDWVHLRMCQGCGHVGCCNDSPGKHGTAHAEQAGHALIRSFEPGESWWYCYVDDVTFQVDGAPAAPSHG